MHAGARSLTIKTPVNGSVSGVALEFQGLGFALELVGVADAPVPALAVKHAQFQLGYVEPTAVLGCVVRAASSLRAIRRASAGGKASYSAANLWVFKLSSTTRMRSAAG